MNPNQTRILGYIYEFFFLFHFFSPWNKTKQNQPTTSRFAFSLEAVELLAGAFLAAAGERLTMQQRRGEKHSKTGAVLGESSWPPQFMRFLLGTNQLSFQSSRGLGVLVSSVSTFQTEQAGRLRESFLRSMQYVAGPGWFAKRQVLREMAWSWIFSSLFLVVPYGDFLSDFQTSFHFLIWFG